MSWGSVDSVRFISSLVAAATLFGTSEFRLTIASQAFHDWSTTAEEKDFRTEARHYSFIKEGYFGGRVEVFTRHGHNLHYYDITSMYPHVMQKEAYPAGRERR